MPQGRAADQAGRNQEVKKNAASIEGDWVGELNIWDKQFRILFQFTQSPTGAISGIFRSPDQTPTPMPMTEIRLKGRNLYIQVEGVGSYRGKLSLKSGRISGDWMGEDGSELKLDLRKQKNAWSYDRPQTPKSPFSYEVKKVVFPNNLASNRLAGILTLPKGRGPFAAAVLVSDFGPQDKDGTIHDHKPLAVIADYLAKKGIASLRYDDRGVGESTGTYGFATTMDLATDAAAAFEFLKKQKRIDSARVGMIGHGEGGLIGPIVATKRDGVAFLVLLAAPGVRGDQMLLLQNDAIGRASGLDEGMLDLLRRLMSSVYQLLTATSPDLARVEKLGAEFEAAIKKLPPGDGVKIVELGALLASQFEQLKTESPWLSWIVTYDPAPVLEQVKCPVLALNGDKDRQVPAEINLSALKRHLISGGNKKVECKKLSGLNHLFQKADTGLPGEYVFIEHTFSTSALKQITDWLIEINRR